MMAENAAINSFAHRIAFPSEVRVLLPTIMFLQENLKIMDEKEEKRKAKERRKNNKQKKDSANASVAPHINMLGHDGKVNEISASQQKINNQHSLKMAYSQLLMTEENDCHKTIKKEMLRIVNEYCERKGISNPEDLLTITMTYQRVKWPKYKVHQRFRISQFI